METAPDPAPRALVVGAGVGGLAAALSLHRAGWSVVVCERSAARRTGGYFVRLAPAGVAAAGRLGLGAALRTRLPVDGVITGVDGSGRMRSRVDFSFSDDPSSLALVRGDLERALWHARPAEIDVRFATGPTGVRQDADGVEVLLADPDGAGGAWERFDLVVGADGVRSTVRALVFGPEEEFRREFDHVVISAILPRLPRGLSEGDYVVLAEPGRSAHLMAMSGHPPVVFFTYRSDHPGAAAAPTRATADPVAALRTVYGDFGGLMPEILDGVVEAGTSHADTVGQIRLESWSRGRVVLLGDAAWCPTLYSGHGSALALAGGESLGRHVPAATVDVPAALAAWEAEHRPVADEARSAGRRARHFYLPGNRVVAALRWSALWFASWPVVGRLKRALPGGRADVHPTVTSAPRPARSGPS